MVTDPIGDLLVRIKNAGRAGLESTLVPHSKMKESVLELLKKEGYITSFEKKGKGVKINLEVELSYIGKRPKISEALRVSKPSRRMYLNVKEIKPIRQGHGSLVLSTPKGLMTDKEARKEHVGGEVLFKIW